MSETAAKLHPVLNLMLLVLVLLSAFTVVHSSHTCRLLYASLQGLEQTHWFLQEDHGRLLLEHSAWASHHRVQLEAVNQLGMAQPVALDVRLVRQ